MDDDDDDCEEFAMENMLTLHKLKKKVFCVVNVYSIYCHL
jgi:hypothetical protein